MDEKKILVQEEHVPPVYSENVSQAPPAYPAAFSQAPPTYPAASSQAPPTYQQHIQQSPGGSNQQPQHSYPGRQYPPTPTPQNYEYVNDNMVLSVISLFFCCILGVIAIVKSREVREYRLRGEYNMAKVAAKSAKTLAIVGIVIGCVNIVLAVFLLMVFHAFSGDDLNSY